MRPKATFVSLLLKFILLVFFGVLIYFGGLNPTLMLIVLTVIAAGLLYFWHERIEVIRVIALAVMAPILEIIATTPSLEIYSYASQHIVTIPY
ncbi:MAG: hypothetical protein GY850_39835, partial [bacterium]|nr:hypothetical protein [bacterium]